MSDQFVSVHEREFCQRLDAALSDGQVIAEDIIGLFDGAFKIDKYTVQDWREGLSFPCPASRNLVCDYLVTLPAVARKKTSLHAAITVLSRWPDFVP